LRGRELGFQTRNFIGRLQCCATKFYQNSRISRLSQLKSIIAEENVGFFLLSVADPTQSEESGSSTRGTFIQVSAPVSQSEALDAVESFRLSGASLHIPSGLCLSLIKWCVAKGRLLVTIFRVLK
jgi:hypothetical protein